MALCTFDVLICLSFSRLVMFVSFLPCDMTLRSGRHDGNRNEVGSFQSQNCKTKFNIYSKPKINRTSDDAKQTFESLSAKTGEKEATYIFEELLGNNTSPSIDWQFHFTDFLVDLFHKVNDKIHQFVFVHLLCVEVGDQKTDIIALQKKKRQFGRQACVCERHDRENLHLGQIHWPLPKPETTEEDDP